MDTDVSWIETSRNITSLIFYLLCIQKCMSVELTIYNIVIMYVYKSDSM